MNLRVFLFIQDGGFRMVTQVRMRLDPRALTSIEI